MRRPLGKLVSLGVLALTGAGAWAQDAASWLTRMNSAVENLSYRGAYVHMQGQTVETLLIVHVNDGGRIRERIMSLDGAGREIIREGEEVRCILPDSETVLFEDGSKASPLMAALPNYSDALASNLAANYDFKLHTRFARIADHRTQIVSIMPKDALRYGYRLWLDADTAMPLQSQLVDEHGNTVEKVWFTQIEMSDSIPRSELAATINTEGFTLWRAPATNAQARATMGLMARELPKGFQLVAATRGPIAGSPYPVVHQVFSDGLATVSVFVEDPKSSPEIVSGFSRLGTANAYSLSISGHQVTAVGEVPRQTVEAIAESLRSE